MRGLASSGVVLGIVGAVAAVAVVVALVPAFQPPKQFAPGDTGGGGPGVLPGGADLNQIRDAADSLRVVILDIEPDADRIAVTVEITERAASSVFLGEPNTFSETLVVEPAGDVWLIAEAPWPIYCWEA